MKSILIVVWVVFSLFIVQPALASTDICHLASQVVDMTPEQIDVFYKSKVAGRLLTGRGTVKSVKKTAGEGVKGNYQVEIFCSPKVIVKFQTNEFWVKRTGAIKEAVVSFSGECTRMHKSMNYVYCIMKATIR